MLNLQLVQMRKNLTLDVPVGARSPHQGLNKFNSCHEIRSAYRVCVREVLIELEMGLTFTFCLFFINKININDSSGRIPGGLPFNAEVFKLSRSHQV